MDARAKKPAAAKQSAPASAERPSREAAEAAVRTLIAWAGDDPTAPAWWIRPAGWRRPTRSSTPVTARIPARP